MWKIFTGAIVRNSENKLLCQLRDDKPGIIFPGYWTCSPGGTVEPGEEPVQAIKREMREEFEIEIKNICQLVTFDLQEKFPGTYHIFTAQMITPTDQVKCNEGQRVDFFDADKALELHQHPLNLKILNYYLQPPLNTSVLQWNLDL